MKIGIKYMSSEKMESLPSGKKLDIIIKNAKNNKIVILEGGLTPEEETDLIKKTMESITTRFKGIEICSFSKNELGLKEKNFIGKLRNIILDLLLRRRGLTIVGPASLVKEIKRDPRNILLEVK